VFRDRNYTKIRY